LTTDIEGAKQFYGQVLGWVMEKSPMEGEPYTVIKTGDRQVGGIMRMPAQVPAGTPPRCSERNPHHELEWKLCPEQLDKRALAGDNRFLAALLDYVYRLRRWSVPHLHLLCSG